MPAIKMGEFPPEMNEVSRPGILSRAFLRETRPRRSRHTSPLDKRHATRVLPFVSMAWPLIMIIQIIMIPMRILFA